MSVPYPLYDKLLAKVKENPNRLIDVKKICSTINAICTNLSEIDRLDHYEEIAALIVHHESLKNDGILLSNVPYNGKVMIGGKGILYYMVSFPTELQHILYYYLEEYAKKE